jgi:hypothetical protein
MLEEATQKYLQRTTAHIYARVLLVMTQNHSARKCMNGLHPHFSFSFFSFFPPPIRILKFLDFQIGSIYLPCLPAQLPYNIMMW